MQSAALRQMGWIAGLLRLLIPPSQVKSSLAEGIKRDLAKLRENDRVLKFAY